MCRTGTPAPGVCKLQFNSVGGRSNTLLLLSTLLVTLQGRKVMQMMVGAPMGQQQQQQAGGSSKADSIKSLPAPTEPAVRLAVAGGEIVAVMPFEGYITPEAAASIRQQLVNALQKGRVYWSVSAPAAAMFAGQQACGWGTPWASLTASFSQAHPAVQCKCARHCNSPLCREHAACASCRSFEASTHPKQ
jgi:hypothetical protein